MSVSIIGAGAFGTALAIALAAGGTPVTLWLRDPEIAARMQETRENERRLPGCLLPEEITVTADFSQAAMSGTILLAIPMQKLGQFLRAHANDLAGKALVACCKGIDLSSLTGPTALIKKHVPTARALILTGPSFAEDIARGLPTALTLACEDDALGKELQQEISAPTLRLYRTTDVIGAELGGALKNVIAIACGVAIGAGLGESARAAVMTRGYAEITRLAEHLGASAETLSGLSGFGDLALTCTSEKSRNYRFGLSLGRGEGFDASITVEGASTADAVSNLAESCEIEMPISVMVNSLIKQEITVEDAIDELLSRPLRKE